MREDRSFYYKDICLSQWDVMKGNFTIQDNKLILNYDNVKMTIKRKQHRPPSSQITDTIFTVSNQVLEMEECAGEYIFRMEATGQVAVMDTSINRGKTWATIKAFGFYD